MKLPGPDHPITIVANPKRVRVLYQGHLIAETDAALTPKEAQLSRRCSTFRAWTRRWIS